MAKLTKEEQEQLEALERKREEPDDNGPGRVLNFTIDLGDENAVKRALKLGFLTPEDLGDDDDDKTDDDDDKPPRKDDKPPRRRGYFEGGKEE